MTTTTVTTTPGAAPALPAEWRDFLALTKPRVMSLVVLTALCGMLAAPVTLPPALAITAILCVALGAGGAGALNQWYEADLDAKMKRTAGRPLPAGRMDRETALQFGIGLSVFSVLTLGVATNALAGLILAASILFYVLVYTVWLKRRTSQNIVIGGAAGAFPPLIGWVAATGEIALLPVLLFTLIFLWTPPHFWSLALYMESDYERAGVPMLPNVAGERATRRQIGLYSLPMAGCAVAPWALGLTGAIYGLTAAVMSAIFVALAFVIAGRSNDIGMVPERRLFRFSLVYLAALFVALVLDVML